MSPIYGQLLDKPLLAFAHLYRVPDERTIGIEKLNAGHLLAVQRAAGRFRPKTSLNLFARARVRATCYARFDRDCAPALPKQRKSIS